MHPELPGAAAPPPGFGEQAVDLLTTFRGIRGVRSRYPQQTHLGLHGSLDRVHFNISRYVRSRYEKLVGNFGNLAYSHVFGTKAEQAYRSLRKNAGQAEHTGDSSRATAIRKALNEIDRYAAKAVRQIPGEHGPAGSSSIGQPPLTAAVAVPQWDWCTAYRNLLGIKKYFDRAGQLNDAKRFRKCTARLADYVYQRFMHFSGTQKSLLPLGFPLDDDHPSRPEQMYRYLKDMADRTEAAGGAGETLEICATLQIVNEKARKELHELTTDYGSLAVLAAKAGMTERQAPATGGPIVTPATAQATVAPPLKHMDPAPGSVSADTRPRTEGAAPPGPEVPLAKRQAIAERFSSDVAVLDAGAALGAGATNALGWSDAQAKRVLADLDRLNTVAAEDPAAAAFLPNIGWGGIEALMGMLDVPPRLPSLSSSSSSSPSSYV